MKRLNRFLLCGCASGLALALTGCQEETRTAEAPRPVRTVIAKATTVGESGRLILPGKSLIILRSSALTREADNPAVLVVQPTRQTLVRKPVVVARYTATQALVESGLDEGDAVVTAGVSRLRPSQKVTYAAGEVAK